MMVGRESRPRLRPDVVEGRWALDTSGKVPSTDVRDHIRYVAGIAALGAAMWFEILQVDEDPEDGSGPPEV